MHHHRRAQPRSGVGGARREIPERRRKSVLYGFLEAVVHGVCRPQRARQIQPPRESLYAQIAAVESEKKELIELFKQRIGSIVVGVDPQYFRPTEVDLLIGNAEKAQKKLGWTPMYTLEDLVHDMMVSDIKLMKKESYLREGGYRILNYFE